MTQLRLTADHREYRPPTQSRKAKVRAQPDGSDSKRLSAYDVVKPKGWVGPQLEGVLKTLSRPEGSA